MSKTHNARGQFMRPLDVTIVNSFGNRTVLGMWIGNDDTQRISPERDLNWRLADILTISVNSKRLFSFKPDADGLRVFNFSHIQMPPQVNRRKYAEELEFIDVANDANIQTAITHKGPRCYLHTAAVRGYISKGGENGGMKFIFRHVVQRNFRGERCKSKYHVQECEHVSAIAAQPARQLVSTARHFSIDPHAGNRTEKMFLRNQIRPTRLQGFDRADVHQPDIASTRNKLLPGY